MDINKFMDDTKTWCSNNYDNIIKMTKDIHCVKKVVLKNLILLREIAKSNESVTDILYQ